MPVIWILFMKNSESSPQDRDGLKYEADFKSWSSLQAIEFLVSLGLARPGYPGG